MLRIGLTGGIGSGKSTVLGQLIALGAAGIDADAISRSTTAAGGSAITAITETFGAEFITPDGALDRARMRELAYRDPTARKRLEQIIHPLVGRESERQVREAQEAGKTCVVFDIPLLVESGRWRARVDRVLVVDCSEETQVTRVSARSALQPHEVRAIIAAQASRSARLAAADAVIFNDGISLEVLAAEVAEAARTFGL